MCSESIIIHEVNPDTLEMCIKRRLKDAVFMHNNELLCVNDTRRINALENEYLTNHNYLLLKELNLIKTLACILDNNHTLTSYPSHIQLEHTTFCNARCIMCDHYVAHNRGSRHLDVADLDHIRHLLPYVSMIIMHGNGEPLINPNITRLMEEYRKYQIRVSLNTNLSYLPDDILEGLIATCKSIHVSCDGADRRQYEGIRQGLRFEMFLNNLKKLTDRNRGIDISLDVVLMRQNISSTEAFVKLAAQYGIKKIYFNALGVNSVIGNYYDSLDLIHDTAVFYCDKAKELGNQYGISVITPFEKDCSSNSQKSCIEQIEYPSPELSTMLHKQNPYYTNVIAHETIDVNSLIPSSRNVIVSGICEYPFFKTYIDLEGNVSFCCPLSRKIVGSLRNESFDEIWNCDLYQRVRQLFYSEYLPICCSNCYFLKNRSLKFLRCNSEEKYCKE